MKKEKTDRDGATTAYLSARSAGLAKEISVRTGRSISGLFKEYLDLIHQAGNDPSRIADVLVHTDLGYVNKVDSPQAPLSLGLVKQEGESYQIDKWISPDTTEAVFLMGTTMRRPIIRYSNLWRSLLENGIQLRIFLQGDLGTEEGRSRYTPVEKDIEAVSQRRAESLHELREISQFAPKDSLEVRNSGNSLIFSSMIAVFRNDGQVDIQVHPINFGYVGRSVKFLVTAPLSSPVYNELVDPIEEMWQQSLPELRSEGNN